MAQLEQTVLREFLLKVSELGNRFFRVNSGMGWTGKTTGPVKTKTTIVLSPGDMVLRKARPFHAGFPKGSSDLVGWTRINITPNMVGRRLAVFTAAEIKTKNVRTTSQQRAFINLVKKSGGIGVVAKQFDHLLEAIHKYKMGDPEDET